jgi:hypothetical protein
MKRRNLLVMIAAAAAWSIVSGPSAGARASSKAKPRDAAVRVRALIQKNSKNTEIVIFNDQRLPPVRIVRGSPKRALGPVTLGSVTLVSFPANTMSPVRILRGGNAFAAGSLAPGGDSGTMETISFIDPRELPVTVLRGSPVSWTGNARYAGATSAVFGLFPAAAGGDLDRVAFAVDGAESSHGLDPGMWRPDFTAPQGPMQVSAAAASDVGGGDRFDLTQNRLLGRGYLALLFRRYGNWPDTIAAYNWGPGNMDGWIAAGQPAIGFPVEVERYRDRVLRDGGLAALPGQPIPRAGW